MAAIFFSASMCLSDSPVHMQETESFVLTLPADGLAPKGVGASTGTVLTEELDKCFFLSISGCQCFLLHLWNDIEWCYLKLLPRIS